MEPLTWLKVWNARRVTRDEKDVIEGITSGMGLWRQASCMGRSVPLLICSVTSSKLLNLSEP